MADTKISGATANAAVVGTDEFATNQGGTSRRTSVDQVAAYVRASLPTAPTIISVGAEFTSTGVPTATLPGTHAANDILVLAIQQSNEANYAAPTGYTRLGPQNGIGAAATAGSTKLCLFWKRDNGAESAPTLTDSGDHTYGVMFAVRGCPTTGDPMLLGGQAYKFTASTTGTSDKSKTVMDSCLIVTVFAHAIDNAAAQGSSPTNADLTSVTEQFDDGTTDGTGGGIYIMSGVKATRGSIGASTVTWGSSTVDVSTVLTFMPADSAENSRPTQIQTFLGSPADLDDTWVKPDRAVSVLVQLCDGGGGGSGGNTTTTAAGGGGGGGGGYDEAIFRADDLAATITVHAGRAGAAGTALLQAGNLGVVSEFDKGGVGPLIAALRNAGTAATAAATADGGNGGCGAGCAPGPPAGADDPQRASNGANAGCAHMGHSAPAADQAPPPRWEAPRPCGAEAAANPVATPMPPSPAPTTATACAAAGEGPVGARTPTFQARAVAVAPQASTARTARPGPIRRACPMVAQADAAAGPARSPVGQGVSLVVVVAVALAWRAALAGAAGTAAWS